MWKNKSSLKETEAFKTKKESQAIKWYSWDTRTKLVKCKSGTLNVLVRDCGEEDSC